MGQAAWCSALFCALFRSLFGLLFGHCFMETVHEHCSQGFEKKIKIKIISTWYVKIFENFLVGDLIYKIFIWRLL